VLDDGREVSDAAKKEQVTLEDEPAEILERNPQLKQYIEAMEREATPLYGYREGK
jgi:hypothetical protein